MNTIYEQAKQYENLKFDLIPINYMDKKPQQKWGNKKFTSEYFNNSENTNIGVRIGNASNNLVDVDIDCEDALKIADMFLPECSFIFGRKSNPDSHRLYYCDSEGTYAKYNDNSTPDTSHKTIIEIRTGQNKMTVIPPSIHPTGEAIEWTKFDAENYKVTHFDDLKKSVDIIAFCVLVGRYTKTIIGKRNEFYLTLAGTFKSQGLELQMAKKLFRAIATVGSDSENRIPTLTATYNKGDDKKITSIGSLHRFHQNVYDYCREYLFENMFFSETNNETISTKYTELELAPGKTKIHVPGSRFYYDVNDEIAEKVVQVSDFLEAIAKNLDKNKYFMYRNSISMLDGEEIQKVSGVIVYSDLKKHLPNVVFIRTEPNFNSSASSITEKEAIVRSEWLTPLEEHLKQNKQFNLKTISLIVDRPMIDLQTKKIYCKKYDTYKEIMYIGESLNIEPILDKKIIQETIDDIYCGIPFASQADKENALATLLTYLLNFNCDSGIPLFYSYGTRSGLGKSTLNYKIHQLIVSGKAGFQSEFKLDNFDRSMLNQKFGYLNFDDFYSKSGIFSSPELCSFITSGGKYMTKLYSQEPLFIKNNFFITMTANHLTLKGDLNQRTLPISLHSDTDDYIYKERIYIQHYISQNREKFLNVLFGMIINFLNDETNIRNEFENFIVTYKNNHPLKRFETWNYYITHILLANGYTNFFENISEFIKNNDGDENEELETFLDSWLNEYNDEWIGSSDLLRIIEYTNPANVTKNCSTNNGIFKSLGKRLHNFGENEIGVVLFHKYRLCRRNIRGNKKEYLIRLEYKSVQDTHEAICSDNITDKFINNTQNLYSNYELEDDVDFSKFDDKFSEPETTQNDTDSFDTLFDDFDKLDYTLLDAFEDKKAKQNKETKQMDENSIDYNALEMPLIKKDVKILPGELEFLKFLDECIANEDRLLSNE